MAGREKQFTVVDAESHVLEPPELWSDYVEAEYRVVARSALLAYGDSADGDVILNGRPVPGLSQSKLPRYAIWRPGLAAEDIGSLDPTVPYPPTAGASDAAARISDMDAMGIDRALLFPTYFRHYFPLVTNPDVAAALARAYNTWICAFAAASPERLLPVAVLPQQNPAMASDELRRVASLGFKAAVVTPVFASGRYPAQRAYDPMWATFEATGVVACIHPLSGPAAAIVDEMDANSPFVERVAAYARMSHPVAQAIAPAMDVSTFLVAIMAEGLMETFPRLKMLFTSAGTSFLPLSLEKAETYLWLSPQAHPVSLEPEKVFFNRSNLVTFHAGDGAMRRLAGRFETVGAFASRYPMQETGDACSAIEDLEAGGVSTDVIARLMGGNAGDLFGLEDRVLEHV